MRPSNIVTATGIIQRFRFRKINTVENLSLTTDLQKKKKQPANKSNAISHVNAIQLAFPPFVCPQRAKAYSTMPSEGCLPAILTAHLP